MTLELPYHIKGPQSEVSLCNKALRYLGAATVLSLSQNSREADLCAQSYTEARNELLCAHHWSFATRISLLAPLQSLEQQGGFYHSYRLPIDCLAVQSLEDDAPFFLCEQNMLWTNATPARARLTVLVEDPTLFPPLFSEALARRLAAALAVPLVNSLQLEQLMFQRFSQAFDSARLADATQDGNRQIEQVDTWLQAR